MDWNEVIDCLKNSKEPDDIDRRRDEIAEWLPIVKTMFDYDQNSIYHQYDLWMHCVYAVLELPKEIDDDMLYLAALLHDIGKPSCRCSSGREGDNYSHYYGHPEKGAELIEENVIPALSDKGVELSIDDIRRLKYYVGYHDDRVSLKMKHLRRHLKLASLDEFKKLMKLQVADAKAHGISCEESQRIEICGAWATKYADEVYEKIRDGM